MMMRVDDVCQYEPDCPRHVTARGLCNTHYRRAFRAGELDRWQAPPRECLVCGTQFRITKHRKACCSEECTRLSNGRRLVLKRLAALPDRWCQACGVEIPTSVRRDARFCSIECQQGSWYGENAEKLRERARQWAADNPGLIAAYRHYRRAMMYAADYETFDALLIADRDGWRCHICSGNVDPQLSYPDLLSKSIDHVIPLSKGGSHTRENVALSHLICNIRKSSRILQ